MKKTLFAALACTMLICYQAQAETVSGKIVSVDGNNITVQNENGQQMIMQTDDNTTYRKKEIVKKPKFKRGKRSSEWEYVPVAEEDDWVEVVYNPNTGDGTVYQVQDIVVYDD